MKDYVILSEDINEIFEKELRRCGLNIVKVKKNMNLYTAIMSHADIAMCKIDNDIIIEASRLESLSEQLQGFNLEFHTTDPINSGKYPEDIRLNLAYTGLYVIHNFKHTDKRLLSLLNKYKNKKNLKFINVNQGYSKCSILIVDEKSLITSDPGIYSELKGELDCLLIEKDHIRLRGLDYGFIGGASGRYRDEIWFYGDLSKHPSFMEIKSFIEKRNLRIKYFKEFELEDVGSIFFSS